MQAAENAAHQFPIARVFIQLEKRRFQLSQDLPRLLAEALLELLGVIWDLMLRHCYFILLKQGPETPQFQHRRARTGLPPASAP